MLFGTHIGEVGGQEVGEREEEELGSLQGAARTPNSGAYVGANIGPT